MGHKISVYNKRHLSGNMYTADIEIMLSGMWNTEEYATTTLKQAISDAGYIMLHNLVAYADFNDTTGIAQAYVKMTGDQNSQDIIYKINKAITQNARRI